MRAFEKAPPDVQEILTKPIKELGLKLEGSPLERLVQQLYQELERKGLRKFRPLCYLTDEWGCPSGEPVIGIPFYLADPRAREIENAVNDLENERARLQNAQQGLARQDDAFSGGGIWDYNEQHGIRSFVQKLFE